MRKLTRACIALAAFAASAVVPATAMALNAATLVTHTGSVVPVGTKIAGTSTTPPLVTNVNTEPLVECKKAHIHGEVARNDHTAVEADITGTSFGECSGLGGVITVTTNVGNGTPWCLRSTTAMATHAFQVRGNSCGAAPRSITVVWHTAIGACNYERANGNPAVGTYTTDRVAGEPDLHLTHQEFKRHNANFFCPAGLYTDMTFDLEETEGTTDLKLVNAQNDATLVNDASPTHNPVAVGTKILGTSTQPSLLTNASTEVLVECTHVDMHGEVTRNDHTAVEGDITSASFTHCTGIGGTVTVTTNVGNGVPWCLRSTTTMATDEFQVRGNSCAGASRSITFVLHTAIGQCAYERANNNPIMGTYTTTAAAGTPDLHVTHQEFKRHNANFFCPATGYIDFTIDLKETVGGTDLKIKNAT